MVLPLPHGAMPENDNKLHCSESDSVLLDCGAATCSQLNIFYGGDESEEIYKRLKGIFISHMHADHYMGLLGLLRMRKKHRLELNPLRLIGPAERLGKWLSFASENIELIRDNIRLIDSKYLVSHFRTATNRAVHVLSYRREVFFSIY